MIGGERPTTPIYNQNNSEETSEDSACRTFFDLIADFHKKQIQKTLKDNNPKFAFTLEQLFEKQKGILTQFLQDNQIPHYLESEDKDLYDLLVNLNSITNTYDCKADALQKYIAGMFFDHPFSLSEAHAANLKKSLFDNTENLSEE